MSTNEMRHAGVNLGEAAPRTDHEAEPAIFGFWIFLMSDLILFALLFQTYSSAMIHGIADGPTPAQTSELWPTFIETMLLLASSFTFGLATITMKYRDSTKPIFLWLAVTALLGLGFIGYEISDFAKLVAEGHTPQTSGYLSAYFTLVATHGIHVSSGLIWMAVLAVQIARFGLVKEVRLRLMRLALFWHMLDIVWIGIFTIVVLYGKIL